MYISTGAYESNSTIVSIERGVAIRKGETYRPETSRRREGWTRSEEDRLVPSVRRPVHPSRGGDEMAGELRGGGGTGTKERDNTTVLSFFRINSLPRERGSRDE